MAAAAIEKLERKSQENGNGYFVFIEGGRIDHGHHETRVGYALDEMVEFDAAVETVIQMTDPRDTLVVVTADHSHTLSMSGYAKRGTPILGMDAQQRDVNGVPYSTLNYAIGKWQSLDKERAEELHRCYRYTAGYLQRQPHVISFGRQQGAAATLRHGSGGH